MTLWQKFTGAPTSFVLAASLGLAAPAASLAQAAAQAPVAVVEDVNGKAIGVEYMDYVAPGQVITLGPKGSIVLGYMTSCWRETITGGTVIIGVEQSQVHRGAIERVKIDCDRDGRTLTERHREFAGSVSRGPSPPSKGAR
jgi:hypothetical protein